MMTSLILRLLLSPVGIDVDLTPALGGKPLTNAALLYPSDTGSYVFSFWEAPIFWRYDVRSKRTAYVGERLRAATFKGPTVRTLTVSQTGLRGERLQLVGGHPAAARPILAISSSKLLVMAASGGMYPVDRATKLPKRAFAISIVRLDARGANPNSDYLLPRDDYGWYEAIDAHANERAGVIDVLVAHTLAGSAQTRFEAYRIAGNQMVRVPNRTGRYGKVSGKTARIWKSVQLARGSGPFFASKVAADTVSGAIAFVSGDKVTVSGRATTLPNAESVQYIVGKLYAGTRSNPDMKTIQKTFVWNPTSRKFKLAGEFAIAGVSPNGKVWVKHYPKTGKFILSQAR